MASPRHLRGTPPPLTPQERTLDLARLMDRRQTDDLWVFAYGSLIWKPCFSCDAMLPATLDGYRRAFNFWSVMARGTPDRPGLGLGLGLEAGGRCQGVAYRLDPATLTQDLHAIWQREMHNDVYRSCWLPLQTPAGAKTAIGFITNTEHAQYAGGLTDTEMARVISDAHGDNGPCRDYLAETVAALATHDIEDVWLSTLLALVDGDTPA